jgi:hypothetical protein
MGGVDGIADPESAGAGTPWRRPSVGSQTP